VGAPFGAHPVLVPLEVWSQAKLSRPCHGEGPCRGHDRDRCPKIPAGHTRTAVAIVSANCGGSPGSLMGHGLSASRRTWRCYAIMISSMWKPSPGKRNGQHGNRGVGCAGRRDIGVAVSLFLSPVRRCAPIELEGGRPWHHPCLVVHLLFMQLGASERHSKAWARNRDRQVSVIVGLRGRRFAVSC
jgi:hypothetical protein